MVWLFLLFHSGLVISAGRVLMALFAAVRLLRHAAGYAQKPGVEGLGLLEFLEREVGANHCLLSRLDSFLLVT